MNIFYQFIYDTDEILECDFKGYSKKGMLKKGRRKTPLKGKLIQYRIFAYKGDFFNPTETLLLKTVTRA